MIWAVQVLTGQIQSKVIESQTNIENKTDNLPSTTQELLGKER